MGPPPLRGLGAPRRAPLGRRGGVRRPGDLSLGGQTYFHRAYSTYLNLDATLFGTSVAASVFGQLKADGRNFLSSIAPPLVCAVALVWAGARAGSGRG